MKNVSLEKLGSFCKGLRDSELRTVALLGCPMKIRKSRHFFLLEVFVRSHLDSEIPMDARISCRLIFKCPKFYPRDPPEVHVRSKNNFPDYLEETIYAEFERARNMYCGSQHIIPMVSSALYMIEKEEQRSIRAAVLDESRNL